MSLATDIADDWEDFDGTEDVTLRQIRHDGAENVPVTNVVFGPLSRRQMLALGVDIAGDEQSCSMNSTEIGARGVERGDAVIRSTVPWTILLAEKLTLGSRWRCVVRKQEATQG